MTVSDYVWEYLADYVDTVFFLPGGGCMHLVDALARQDRIKPVAMLDERHAGIAALGYAMERNGLGVCLVTTGPGGTNAVTPCAAAWVDYVPVLFLSGQVPIHLMKIDERQCGPQEIGIVDIVRTITKWPATMKKPNMVPYFLDSFCDKALERERGPVWMDIPLDVQGATIE